MKECQEVTVAKFPAAWMKVSLIRSGADRSKHKRHRCAEARPVPALACCGCRLGDWPVPRLAADDDLCRRCDLPCSGTDAAESSLLAGPDRPGPARKRNSSPIFWRRNGIQIEPWEEQH